MTIPELEPAVTVYDLDGQRRAVRECIEVPEKITLAAFKRMSTANRKAWLQDREAHHGRSHVVETPAMIEAFGDVHLMMKLNKFRPDDRELYLISGRPGSGKTTIARSIGREHEKHYAAQYPRYRSSGEIPVVFVATPAKCSPTAFDHAVLTFMHHSYPDNFTHQKLKARVVQALRNHRVQLVIIDDLHRLKPTSNSNIETSDLLKEYFDLSTATFIYIGVNLTTSGFFRGSAGQQILNRGSLLELEPFSNELGPARDQWRRVVSELEDNLRLLRHTRGTLTSTTMLALLYNRTHGSLNALNKLLQTATERATTIPDDTTKTVRNLGIVGKERIDIDLIRTIKPMAAVTVERKRRKATR